MKIRTRLVILTAALAVVAGPASAFNYSFWDGATDSPPGGSATPNGIWENANWNTLTAASTPSFLTVDPTVATNFVEGSDAHFCAGLASQGQIYSITVNSNHTVGAFFMDVPANCTMSGPGVLMFNAPGATGNGDAFRVAPGGVFTISNQVIAPTGTTLSFPSSGSDNTSVLTMAGNITFGDPTNVFAASVLFGSPGTLNLSGNNTFAATSVGQISVSGTGTLNLSGTNVFGASTSTSAAEINISAAGTVVLSGSNSFGGSHSAGIVSIAAGGTLVIASDNCFTGPGAPGNISNNGNIALKSVTATISCSNNHTITGIGTGIAIDLRNGGILAGGQLTLSNGGFYCGTVPATITLSNTTIFTGANGPYGVPPHLQGPGELILNYGGVSHSWSAGPLFLDGATLGIGSSNQAFSQIPTSLQIDSSTSGYVTAVGSAQTIIKPLTFTAAGGTYGFGIIGSNALTFSGGTTLATSGNTDIITNASTADLTLSGTISGDAALNTYGPGRIVISAPATGNTYTADTSVYSGVIKAINNTSGSATGGGTVQLLNGTLTGTGIVGGVNVNANATIVPGDAPNAGTGTLTTSNETWNSGGHYTWEIGDATGTEGGSTGWDKIVINGGLIINAFAGNTFNIDITSVTSSNTYGGAAHFNPNQSATWRILTATNGITGFSADAFNLNTGGFSNAFSGAFSIVQNGNDLDLVYTAPPSITVSSFTILGNRTAQIGVTGFAGSNYVVQAATNLAPPVTWTNLSTNLAGVGGTFQYNDTNATNFGRRYYRISTP